MAVTRREQILGTAASLFAERGFHGVSVVDLGAACGISGPALYKHFESKDAMLAEMLVDISEELLRVGRRRSAGAPDAATALRALVGWHVEFALRHAPLIVVQDRDWASLPDEARERVRTLQRRYVALWVDRLREVHPGLTPRRAAARAHAAFGMLNSTPHSAMLPEPEMAGLLTEMALRALDVPAADPAAPRVSPVEVAAEVYAECVADGQSARRVPHDEHAAAVRTEVRRLARVDGVRIRTARLDDTVVAVRLDTALWSQSTAVMRARLSPRP